MTSGLLAKWSRPLLRALAVAIAAAGVIDPAWSAMRPAPSTLIAVRASAIDSRSIEPQLRDADHTSATDIRELVRGRVPCAPGERCVLIADGSVDVAIPADVTPSLIAVRAKAGTNVAVRSVTIDSAHIAAASTARVEISASGVANRKVAVRVRDGAATVGSATATLADGLSTIDVPWWPLDAGARRLRVEIDPLDGESTAIDNAIDVGVDVAQGRRRVLIYDPRPSWSSTFVRRALEDDPRFAVEHCARVAPAITTGTANARLDATILDDTELLIVGAPDLITADEAALIDRYARVRGGSVILLPEQRVEGAAARWMTGWTEELVPTPIFIGPLRAGEVLHPQSLGPAQTVVAASPTSPVIVDQPIGLGRVIVSGAMDAWRYRDANADAFDRFWRSLAADAAGSSAPLTIAFADTLAATGSRVPFTLSYRSLRVSPALDANATARCADGAAQVVRLWPGGVAGEFQGELTVGSGSCTLDAMVADHHATASVTSADNPNRGVERTLTRLEASLPHEIASATPALVSSTVHPMRSPWWMLPFAGCLSIEWWLRRRAGLR